MPATRDPDEIRAILNTDRGWAVYPLGDLAPALFAHSAWARSVERPPTLVLLYQGFDPPVVFALGGAARVPALLDELGHDGDVFLHVRPEVLDVLRPRYRTDGVIPMWRMVLAAAAYRPRATDAAVRLGPADCEALRRLYADGAAHGESPHFFLPSMVEEGVFFGVYEGPELIAAGGTHLVVPEEGAAAVGNIYTRRDRRGRGFGASVTSAVVNELLRRRLPTIALNVAQQNAPAVRVYERLGFVRHCAYHEGLAQRRPALPKEGLT